LIHFKIKITVLNCGKDLFV